MNVIYLKIITMSMSACLVILTVLILRGFLCRAPRKYACLLWMFVFFRLLCPFQVISPFSLIPVPGESAALEQKPDDGRIERSGETLFSELLQGEKNNYLSANHRSEGEKDLPDRETPQPSGQGEAFNHILSQAVCLPRRVIYCGVPFGTIWIEPSLVDLFSLLWLVGCLFLLAVGALQWLLLKRRLRTAVLLENHPECRVYESDAVSSAFLMGMISPRIYLPVGMKQGRTLIIAHERMHKKRLDHITKPLCCLAVVIHWFNPLVWLSFYLLAKDMELSCDEQVLEQSREDLRAAYASSLLRLSAWESGIPFSLFFGKSHTEIRIKRVIKYQKPSRWVQAGALTVCMIAAVTLTGTQMPARMADEESVICSNIQQRIKAMGLQANDERSPSFIQYNDEKPSPEGALSQYNDEEVSPDQESDPVKKLDALISQELLSHASNTEHTVLPGSDQVIGASQAVEAHRYLGGEEAVFEQLISSNREMVFYLLAQYGIKGRLVEPIVEQSGLDISAKQMSQMQKGGVFPVKVTISIAEDGAFRVKEFWMPGDGAEFEAEVKAHFPQKYWQEIFDAEEHEKLSQTLMQKSIIFLE